VLRAGWRDHAGSGSAFDPPAVDVEPDVASENFKALLLCGVVVRRDIAVWIRKDLCAENVALVGEREALTADGIVDKL
jgi:hypothetical protein